MCARVQADRIEKLASITDGMSLAKTPTTNYPFARENTIYSFKTTYEKMTPMNTSLITELNIIVSETAEVP